MAIPVKNTSNLKVTISSIVENILAVDNVDPYFVISMTIKHVNPAELAAMFPIALSRLLPKESLI